MTKDDEQRGRVSAIPRLLYRAEQAQEDFADTDRDGFFVGMLKDDLRTQRYAYEVRLDFGEHDRSIAAEKLLALMNDFNYMGQDNDPTALIFDLVSALLDDSAMGRRGLVLEQFLLADEFNAAKSARRYGRPETSSEGALPSLGYVPHWSLTGRRNRLTQVSTKKGSAPSCASHGPHAHA